MPIPINKKKNHNFPKDEKAWVSLVNLLHDDAISKRQTQEAQWARNIAYYFGYQHLMYDETIRMIQIDTGQEDQYIINRIAPLVEQRVAKLTRARPTTSILPDSNEPLRIKAAEKSEQLSRYLWKILKKDEKLDLATLLMVLMGSCFKKVCWEADGGEPVLNDLDKEGDMIIDEETGQQIPDIVFMGEVGNYVRNAFEILGAPGSTMIENSPWMMERCNRPVQDVSKAYSDFDPIKVRDRKDEMTRFERFVNNLASPLFGGTAFMKTNNDIMVPGKVTELDLIMTKEFWLRPNDVYPEGLKIVIAGDQLLDFNKWPYRHMEMPFSRMDEHVNPFSFYGTSTVSRVIPIQRKYNQGRTQQAKNIQLMGNVKWWVPKGAGLAEDALTDEEGEVVETNPNVPMPQQLGVAPLPNYVMSGMDQDIMDFRDVGGERSVDQQPFAGLTAGVAIETMAELSDIGIGPTIKNMERCMIREIRQELMIANQKYTDERTIKIMGARSGEFSVITLKNTDLMNQTDVTIQLESSLGQSRAAARQNLMDMWDRRIITDPELFMQAFAVGDIDIVLKQKDPARELVISQIEQIKQGAQPQVMPFDNHIVHISMLTEFLQTPEFRRMPPDRQQLGMMTLQQHIQFVQPQQQPGEQNQAAVGTPFGAQRTEGQQ